MKRELDWIPARQLPWSKASTYRLCKAGLLTLKKLDGKAMILQQEVNQILALLRKENRDD